MSAPAIDELLAAGHTITGLARPTLPRGARGKGFASAAVTDDLDGIRAGAEAADAVFIWQQARLANRPFERGPSAPRVQTIGMPLVGTAAVSVRIGRRRPHQGGANESRRVSVPRRQSPRRKRNLAFSRRPACAA